MFTARCPRCQTDVTYDRHYPGVRIRCDTCKHVFTGPAQAKEDRVPAKTDHLPYCSQCDAFVEPQVVASTQVSGGRTIVAPNGFGLTQVDSRTVYKKFCRTCGSQVYSKLDADAIMKKARLARREQIWVYVLLAFFALVILVFVLSALH